MADGMQTRLADPASIPIHANELPTARAIRRQAGILSAQGQIEPIVLREGGFADLRDWPHANAMILAAQMLDWPTIMVAERASNG